jgi:hypothetical protein
MPKGKGNEVKKVEYITFALTHAIITTVLSIVLAIIYYIYLVSVLRPLYVDIELATGFSTATLAILIPLSAVLGFIGGFLVGLIWALLYNFVVSRFLKFKVET